MTDFGDKLIIAFISAIFGIVAAVLTPRFLDWQKRRRIKRQLTQELYAVKEELADRKHGVVAGVKALENKFVITTGSRRISNFIFENYYKEICGYLPANDRSWLESLHLAIGHLNSLSDRLNTLVWDTGGKPSLEEFERAKIIVHSLFRDVHMLDWEISYYLNKSNDRKRDLYSAFHEGHWDERERIVQQLSTLTSEPKIVI